MHAALNVPTSSTRDQHSCMCICLHPGQPGITLGFSLNGRRETQSFLFKMCSCGGCTCTDSRIDRNTGAELSGHKGLPSEPAVALQAGKQADAAPGC